MRFYVPLLLFVVSFLPIFSSSQAQSPDAGSDRLVSAGVANSKELRTALSGSLNVMGGQAAWSTVQSVTVHGEERTGFGSANLVWMDDLGTRWRMRRWSKDASGHVFNLVKDETAPEQDSKVPLYAKGQQAPTAQLRTQRETHLMVHLPAAALLLVTGSEEYQLVADEHFATVNELCVLARKQHAETLANAEPFEICVDKRTSLPTRARIWLRDLSGSGRLIPEIITYSSFQQVGAVKVPQTVSTKRLGFETNFTFTSFDLAPRELNIHGVLGGAQ